jgi:uncharacterized protein (PEP-CTERM system associated)
MGGLVGLRAAPEPARPEPLSRIAPPRPVVERVTPSIAPIGDGTAPLTGPSPDQAVPDQTPPAVAAPRPKVDLPALRRAGLAALPGYSRSRISEEITIVQHQVLRTMRAAIAAEDGNSRNSRVVLVTSARPGEGKTYCALNIAVSLAASGAVPVVLIDADGKAGGLSDLLSLSDQPGLRALATNLRQPPRVALVDTEVSQLLILPFGAQPQSSAAATVPAIATLAAAVERMAAALPEHILIVDAQPCLASSDSATLASIAGQVLMVVEAERTARSEVEAALDMVDACQTLQLVLNKVRLSGNDTFGAYTPPHGHVRGSSPPRAMACLLAATALWAAASVWPAVAQTLSAEPAGAAASATSSAAPAAAADSDTAPSPFPAFPLAPSNVTDRLQQGRLFQRTTEGAAVGEGGLASGLLPGGVTGTPGSTLFGAAVPPAATAGRKHVLAPSLGFNLLATDNINQTGTDRRSEFGTIITPALFASTDTLALRGTLNYAPVIQFYVPDSDQNRVDHRLNGQAVAALLPQTLFLDVRATAATFAPSGTFGASGTAPVTTRSDSAQTYSGQISPYLVHRFGGLATVSLGYAFLFGSQSGSTNTLPGQSQPFFQPQSYTAQQGYLVARTGEDFGRFALEARASGTVFTGTSIYDGAHRTIGTVEARYAVLRSVAVLAEIGYQDEEFATTPRFRYVGPVWSAGLRFAPTPDTYVIAKYGERSGYPAAYVNAVVPLGTRTTLYTTYVEALSTALIRTQDLLATTTLDALGNPVDQTTGAPVSYADSFLATQSGVFRSRRLNALVSQNWPRDTVTLGVGYQQLIPVAAAPGTQVFGQRGPSVSAGWSREVSPRTQVAGYLQYGRTFSDFPGGDGTVVTAQATLRYRFTERLIGTALYRLTNRSAYDATGNSLQNLFLVGLQVSL